MFNLNKKITLLIALVALSACGYQLRGQAPGLASDQRIWLNDSGDLELGKVLKKSLLQSKAQLLSNSRDKRLANSVITLGQSTINQSASAYNSEGDVIEYNLYYKLGFSINNEAYNFSSTLSYQYNKAQLLSSEQNKKVATQELLDLAAAFILRQL